MALWNEKAEGDELEECPICFVNIAKRKRTIHVKKCYEMYESSFDERGLVLCPLHSSHIMPKKYLNHHLEGNCESVENALRRFFELPNGYEEIQKIVPPDNFLADCPEEINLNYHNRQLLYLLKKDLTGRDISSNRELYPDPSAIPKP